MFLRSLIIAFILMPSILFSQVQVRDSILDWQHHSFILNADHSMNWYTTDDNDIQQVQFNAKVIENELIRLVLLPEYGGRIISFVYKPTEHEYLYQSVCGSAYGMNEGNFYYNWLMVYGGIFPTFPEPEHGKTWLLPWDFDIVKNTGDTVIIGMEYTDISSYANAPGQFNNGITDITCRVEVAVYSGSSLWDFNVSLTNNKNETIIYEYWTCTTLTPGSETGDTGSPLNSEMTVPIEMYKAGWSPGSWIGNYGSLYDFTDIDHLYKWDDMGIAYAYNLSDNYWGVINHENEEGIFRISENIETYGMKFWTWGKDNIDNDLFDFSNGGQDNYIELWAGVSEMFFDDAVLTPYEQKNWIESYAPSSSLSSMTEINRELAVNIGWNQNEKELSYELFAFQPGKEYQLVMYLTGDDYYPVTETNIFADPLGNSEGFILDNLNEGNYTAILEVYDTDNELILTAEKEISYIIVSVEEFLSGNNDNILINIQSIGNKRVHISFSEADHYTLQIFNLSGQLISNRSFAGSSTEISLPSKGLYIINSKGKNFNCNKKVMVY